VINGIAKHLQNNLVAKLTSGSEGGKQAQAFVLGAVMGE